MIDASLVPGKGNVFAPDGRRIECDMKLSDIVYAMPYAFKGHAWVKVFLYCGCRMSVYLVLANGTCTQECSVPCSCTCHAP